MPVGNIDFLDASGGSKFASRLQKFIYPGILYFAMEGAKFPSPRFCGSLLQRLGLSMNTLAETPVSSHAPDFSVQSTAAPAAVAEIRTIVAPNLRKWNMRRVKELLVSIYAYGLLAFGLFFPLVLAAWAKFFWPEAG